jgi:serine/threonine protein kinase/Tol biopolymer transport system component
LGQGVEEEMIGQTLSHYKILEKLGEGGMGVVYKAEDTKLDRLVALKFLPPHLAASEQDKARFIQEAKAASALNHPNVCTIHAIEEHEGQLFIAMEFVDGQTLREKQATINLGKAIDIGTQIADGLAAAHEKGIVHRDIKPENIMIRKDGIAQIMDFGLAKLRASGSKITRLTKEGSTVGTAGYMSPEQIQGLEADHRSDIFSLGVLLYELFVGELPFKGVHETALAYEIVNVDPAPLSTVKPEIDPELDRIVLECLQKEPDERYNSVKDIAKDLKRFKRESSRQRVSRITAARPAMKMTQPAEPVELPRSPWKNRFGYILSGLMALVIGLLLLSPWKKESAVVRSVVRAQIELPTDGPLNGSSGIAISPDGRLIAYVGKIANGTQLFLHHMDQLSSEPIPGTENAGGPAFSPNGQWIVFNSIDQKVVRVSVEGGAPEVLCSIGGQLTRGLSWSADNTILIGTVSNRIFRVPASGGTPEAISTLDSSAGEISHRFPQMLPDGKTMIFTAKQNNITTFDDALIVAQRLATGERKILVRGGTYARYIPTGHLIYIRGNHILAVPFDPDRLEVTGSPVPVETGGWMNRGSGLATMDISNNGTMVFAASSADAMFSTISLAWLDRNGVTHPLLDTLRGYVTAAISPDGQKIAVNINAANNDIWIYHIARGVLTRLTFGGGNNDWPLWSPDGRFVIYSAEKGQSINLFRKPWDGSGNEERLTSSTGTQIPFSLTPDGGLLTFIQEGDLWVLPLDPSGKHKDEKPWPFIQSPATELGGYISPDGRWIAYQSNESGKSEVYVTAFPKREGKWQISSGGATKTFWSRNGKELFFVSGTTLMVVNVLPGATFDFSLPKKVCEIPSSATIQDISLDGQLFLVTVRQTQLSTLPTLQVVTDWFEVVKGKFNGNKN